MTYARGALSASPVLALIALLISPGNAFPAHTVQRVWSQTPAPTVTRRNLRGQQSSLIRHNEAGAIRNLFTLFSSEATYQATTGNGDYGTLAELRKEMLIDSLLAEGHRFGYLFRVRREKHSSESPSLLEIVAVPRTYGRTGRRSFFMNETGEIHVADKRGAEADVKDRLIVIDP